jgi:hypothetical protein
MNKFILAAKTRMIISLCLVGVVVLIDFYGFFYLRFIAFKPKKEFTKIEAVKEQQETMETQA